MNKSQAQTSIRKINAETCKLNPSVIITLFEFDLTNLLIDLGKISSNEVAIYRFHNNVKLFGNNIIWQGNEYLPAPISAEGFELTTQGVLPTPKIAIHVDENSVPVLAVLKDQLFKLSNDLGGTKVTRIRTFLKYLDKINFIDQSLNEIIEPDPNAEFPRDVYFIDRKSIDDKYRLEFELVSIFDLQNLQLPGRLVFANSCAFQYRGEGCLYEYNSRRNPIIHSNARLPSMAPPIANDSNEKIIELLYGIGTSIRLDESFNKGSWQNGVNYAKGSFVYIVKGNIKYYFVAKENNPPLGPPNTRYWVADQCSKRINGCVLRYGEKGSALGVTRGYLPFGGFPAANKFR